MITLENLSEEKLKQLKDYFSFYNKDYIKFFQKIRQKHLDNILGEDYYKYFIEIIRKSGKLTEELKFNDPVSISVLYEYLLWNGYFSKDNNLVYSISDRINNIGLVGADIMKGKSVCLNNADMLSYILRERNIEAYTIGCTVPNNDGKKFQYRPEIERNIANVKFKDYFVNKVANLLGLSKLGNHAVTCFNFNGVYSVCDPTSLAFLNFTDINKMEYVGRDTEAILKSWVMVLLNDMFYEQFEDILLKILIHSDLKPLQLDNIRKISELTMKICTDNQTLLGDFHSDIYPEIEGICKTLKK